MALTNGTRLGPYEIVSPLGAGGMGEVYRARDTQLDREVALKILPASFAGDPDRLMRFEREAKTLASLNHPNIAAIYGLESGGGQRALVMELVEGEDLSVRIARGAIPPADTVAIARQIIDALEAAHEAGIVHRDLKPANIKIRDDGTVKVLDFGLARWSPGYSDPGSKDPELRSGRGTVDAGPTMTSPALTAMGVILGTASYMAPEQAKGRPVDKRADIWAFGVIWCEMLTGRSAFPGETVTDVIAAVVTRDPDWADLPAATPAAIRRLLQRCLQKDPKRRLRDIGDVRIALDEAEQVPVAEVPAPVPARSSRLLVGVLAAAAIASVALAGWLWQSRTRPARPVHLSIALPAGHALLSGPAISRDGRQVAFVSSDGIGRPQLYIRDIDAAEPRLIPGTEEASDPFFSPNGRWVAFYAGNSLLKVSVDGGAPVALADSMSHDGGTWTDAGMIIFNKAWNGGLEIIGENGGSPPKPLIAPTPPDEYAYTWPYAIPGTDDVLFASWGKEFNVLLLDTSTMEKRIVCGGCWRRLAWVPSGHIIGANGGDLLAGKLTEAGDAAPDAVAVMQGVEEGSMNGNSPFDVSQNGTLLYVRNNEGRRTLVTADRRGQVSPLSAPVLPYSSGRIAPDGRRALVTTGGSIGIVDLERGTATPLTPELDARGGSRTSPVWSRDGLTVTFSSNHEGNWEIYSRAATGAGDVVPVLKKPMEQHAQSYAPDGTLLFITIGPQTGTDLWMLPPGGEAQAWLATGAEEDEGRFSPDGRLVAYVSNASGRDEVYVQSRDDASDRLQVSADGGRMPVWSPKGDRLFFRQGNAIMEAVIRTGGRLSAGAPVRLFDGGWTLAQRFPFDVMPDGEQFLMVQQPPEAVPTRIEVVLNWFTMLQDKMGRR